MGIGREGEGRRVTVEMGEEREWRRKREGRTDGRSRGERESDKVDLEK